MRLCLEVYNRKFTSTMPKALCVDYVSLVFGLWHSPEGDVPWNPKRLQSEEKMTKDIEPSCI